MTHSHGHSVNETKARSMLKAISGRIIEITIGTLVFGTILSFLGFHAPYEMGLMLNLTEETLCAIITYITERIWNRINWGRRIIETRLDWWSGLDLDDIEGDQ